MSDLLEKILADLKRLRVAYERRGLLTNRDGGGASSGSAPSPLARDLLLADGLLRNVVGGAPRDSADDSSDDERPFHITVFGGTQVGKSTMANVLAGRELARVHHTAGFTRHAQGFTPPGCSPDSALAAFPRAFPGYDRVPREALSMDRPMEYSLEELPSPTALEDAVLWDAPDCDAVDSSLFQQGFVEALTLADCVVYVTSREKYAVNAILAWVARLNEAGVGVVSVLNMTPHSQQAELTADMATALQRVREQDLPGQSDANDAAATPPVIAFEYVADGDVSALYDSAYEPTRRVREIARETAQNSRQQGPVRQTAAIDWITRALPSILDPALRDLDAWQQWNDALDQALKQFVDDYRRFYLDDPQRYDAFSRVGLEILELLNPPIPGLKKTLSVVRTAVSLPARALLAGGRAAYNYATSGGKGFGKPATIPHEIATYREANDKLLNHLARYLEQRRRGAEGGSESFWQTLDQGWEAQLPLVEEEFQSALAAHRARSEQWIKETAEGIYKELERNPVKLNVLRSSRIAADAAAIVVSIKTGGPGDIVHDIVVAPALMSVVEAATRQIAGSYVDQCKAQLRERLTDDTARFADEVYGEKLRELATHSLEKIGLEAVTAEDIRTLPDRLQQLKKEVA